MLTANLHSHVLVWCMAVEPCAARPPVKRNGQDDHGRGHYTRSVLAHGFVRYIKEHPSDPEQLYDPTFDEYAK